MAHFTKYTKGAGTFLRYLGDGHSHILNVFGLEFPFHKILRLRCQSTLKMQIVVENPIFRFRLNIKI